MDKGALNPLWSGRFREGDSETLINKGIQGWGAGDALNTRASGHLFLEMRLRFYPRVFLIFPCRGDAPKPVRIGRVQAWRPEMPCLQGLQSTPPGDALNTRASGQVS